MEQVGEIWKATDVRKQSRTSISHGHGQQIGVLLKDGHMGLGLGNFEFPVGFFFLFLFCI
jgi:hypothetical protein